MTSDTVDTWTGIAPAPSFQLRLTYPGLLAIALPILATFALYLHAVIRLAAGLWRTEDGLYSPFLLVLAGILGARRWRESRTAPIARPSAWGVAFYLVGLLLLLSGRLLGNISIEFGSVLIVVPALLIALEGWAGPLRYGYALATMAVAVPLPGSIVVALTFPLKMAASASAARLLSLFGLPIDRDGVTLDIGNYRLMVVDACSGLQSMYSLLAAVFLYLALVGYRSRSRTILLLAAILPIAFLANVVRVVILALVTFWFGDAAGEGFLHGFAGITMFVIALLGIMALDRGPATAS